jgi:hypothetical protein
MPIEKHLQSRCFFFVLGAVALMLSELYESAATLWPVAAP